MLPHCQTEWTIGRQTTQHLKARLGTTQDCTLDHLQLKCNPPQTIRTTSRRRRICKEKLVDTCNLDSVQPTVVRQAFRPSLRPPCTQPLVNTTWGEASFLPPPYCSGAPSIHWRNNSEQGELIHAISSYRNTVDRFGCITCHFMYSYVSLEWPWFLLSPMLSGMV